VFTVPRIPLIDDLTVGQTPQGSNILVEFDAASQWYNCCLTIAAGWMKDGGNVGYNGFTRPPDDIRSHLRRLGLDVDGSERNDRLRVYDWYTSTLGRKSKERYGIDSLRVADQSIVFRLTEDELSNPEETEWLESLRIADNFSVLARFNEERPWIEFMLTRVFPIGPVRKSTLVFGIMKGVHSEWALRQLEGSADGILDFKLDDVNGKFRDVIQIRTMRNVHFNRQPVELKMGENFEVTLQ
jgi:KaiC/GvpD/RAD55 family RecA-like ATPase